VAVAVFRTDDGPGQRAERGRGERDVEEARPAIATLAIAGSLLSPAAMSSATSRGDFAAGLASRSAMFVA